MREGERDQKRSRKINHQDQKTQAGKGECRRKPRLLRKSLNLPPGICYLLSRPQPLNPSTQTANTKPQPEPINSRIELLDAGAERARTIVGDTIALPRLLLAFLASTVLSQLFLYFYFSIRVARSSGPS